MLKPGDSTNYAPASFSGVISVMAIFHQLGAPSIDRKSVV